MKIIILDTETTMRNKGEGAVGGFSANPFFPNNTVICGVCISLNTPVHDGSACSYSYFDWGDIAAQRDRVIPEIVEFLEKEVPDIIVGANIAFDLHYLLREEAFWNVLKNCYVWDIQTMQWILSGGEQTFPSLEEMANLYEVPKKLSTLSDVINAGGNTEDVALRDLIEYCIRDTESTRDIFIRQFNLVGPYVSEEVVFSRMQSYKAKILTEHSGMFFHRIKCEEAVKEEERELLKLEEELKTSMQAVGMLFANPSSNPDIGTYLYGGVYKYKTEEPVLDVFGRPVLFKSGLKVNQPKTKLVKKEVVIPAASEMFSSMRDKFITEGGNSKVDDATLEKLWNLERHPFLSKLREHRKVSKNLNTYLKGVPKLVWGDFTVHPTLNTNATATGRYSCSEPNLQNVSNKGED